MLEDDLVDVKVRLYDGSDIGPFRYTSAYTVEILKERIVSEWPKGNIVVPKVANEIKLISFGKILENNKTVGQCRAPFGELAGGVVVMHVVVQPSQGKTKAGTITRVRLRTSDHPSPLLAGAFNDTGVTVVVSKHI